MFRITSARYRCGIALIAVLVAVTAVCQTPALAASPKTPQLKVFDASLVDKTVDPCENFYQFSCKKMATMVSEKPCRVW